jgi:hypothetical protein
MVALPLFCFCNFRKESRKNEGGFLHKMKRHQKGHMVKMQSLKYPDILHYEWEGECLEQTDDGILVWGASPVGNWYTTLKRRCM